MKMPGELLLKLERTEDILAGLGKNKHPGQILVGFAAETDDLELNALEKLQRKNLDWIAANKVADGFGTDRNTIVMYSRNGKKIHLPDAEKSVIAKQLIETILANG